MLKDTKSIFGSVTSTLLEKDIPTRVEKLKLQIENFSLKTNKPTQKQNKKKTYRREDNET